MHSDFAGDRQGVNDLRPQYEACPILQRVLWSQPSRTHFRGYDLLECQATLEEGAGRKRFALWSNPDEATAS